MFRVRIIWLNPKLFRVASGLVNVPFEVVQFVHEQTSSQGATVPFLARYRRDNTGGLEEPKLQQTIDVVKELFAVEAKRARMLKNLSERGLLTPALQENFERVVTVDELADIWEPFKEKKLSKAKLAREAGLEPIAKKILETAEPITDWKLVEAVPNKNGWALLTALLVEKLSVCSEARETLLKGTFRFGTMDCVSASIKVKKSRGSHNKEVGEAEGEGEEQGEKQGEEHHKRTQSSSREQSHWIRHFSSYHTRRFRIATIPSHNTLAVFRGESLDALDVTFSIPQFVTNKYYSVLCDRYPVRLPAVLQAPRGGQLDTAGTCLAAAVKGAYAAAMKSVLASVRRELKKEASYESSVVFAHNVRHLLMQRPMRGMKLLAMDPGVTHGTKCVVLNEAGGLVGKFIINIRDKAAFQEKLVKVLTSQGIERIVIGNGTACRDVEQLVAECLETNKLHAEFAITSEVGASVYSVSPVARSEFPTLDVMYLGAVSIGRRVLDPLAELVKIPVKSLGVGQYQHDIDETLLLRELNRAVEGCIASVGINFDTSNAILLRKLPGLHVDHFSLILGAKQNGTLKQRQDLAKILPHDAYTQIAGFVRFPSSPNVLDCTGIHPESYPHVEKLIKHFNVVAQSLDELRAFGKQLQEQLASSPDAASTLCSITGCGESELHLIVQELNNPAKDPRDHLHTMGLFRRSTVDISTLKPGTVLQGVVSNVTQFGAFVDVGLSHANMLIPVRDFSLNIGDVLSKIIVDTVDTSRSRVTGVLPPELKCQYPPMIPDEILNLQKLRHHRKVDDSSGESSKSIFLLGAMTDSQYQLVTEEASRIDDVSPERKHRQDSSSSSTTQHESPKMNETIEHKSDEDNSSPSPSQDISSSQTSPPSRFIKLLNADPEPMEQPSTHEEDSHDHATANDAVGSFDGGQQVESQEETLPYAEKQPEPAVDEGGDDDDDCLKNIALSLKGHSQVSNDALIDIAAPTKYPAVTPKKPEKVSKKGPKSKKDEKSKTLKVPRRSKRSYSPEEVIVISEFE